jgi:hypothetical protein
LNIILTASGALPSITSGAADVAQAETATNRQNDAFVDFATGVQSFAEWGLVMPFGWNGTGLLANVYWTTTSASTASVVWGVQLRAYTAGDALDSAYGSAIETTSANGGANLENVSATTPQSTPITIAGANYAHTTLGGGSLVAPQRLKVRVYRLGSGADTLAATARLSMVRLLESGD